MSVYMDKPSKDSSADFFLIFIDEERNKDTEERFALYLEEYDNYNYNYNENRQSKTYDSSYKEKISELLKD